jgi:hypothetical protein
VNKLDARDWFIMLLAAMVWIAGTVFIFIHATKDNAVTLLATWGGICTTFGGIYHWFVIRDQKVPDACAS